MLTLMELSVISQKKSIKKRYYKMKGILTITTIIIANLCFAQNIENKELSHFARINLGLQGLDVSYELPISNQFVWENSLGIGMGSSVNGSSVEYLFDFSKPTPYIKSELKYIYNNEERISKQKRVLNNSGNYIALQTKYSFGNSNHYKLNQTLLTEVHWGIQRPLGKRFIFNIHVGLGYIKDFDSENGNLTPSIGLRFGYKLF